MAMREVNDWPPLEADDVIFLYTLSGRILDRIDR
jgi:hypothetical protein